jgi:hypothetical protein
MGIQETRLERTARYLENEALDGLIAVNYGHNSFLESHAVFALTGLRPIGESALEVDRAGGSTLIVTPAWDADRAAALSHTEKTIGTDDLPAALASVLDAPRIDARRTVTVGLATLGRGLAHRIEAVLGGNSRADDSFVREVARIRSPEELAAARHGLGITSDLPGDITIENERRLEEGMMFVMHPNQYLPETGYLMCGGRVVISAGGAQLLSREAELDCVAV